MGLFFHIDKVLEKAKKEIMKNSFAKQVVIERDEPYQNRVNLTIGLEKAMMYLGKCRWDLKVFMFFDYNGLKVGEMVRQIVRYTMERIQRAGAASYDDDSFYLYHTGKYFTVKLAFSDREGRTISINKTDSGIERFLILAISPKLNAFNGLNQLLDIIQTTSDTGRINEIANTRHILNMGDVKKCEKEIRYRGKDYLLYDFRRFYSSFHSKAPLSDHVYYLPGTPSEIIAYLNNKIEAVSNVDLPQKI